MSLTGPRRSFGSCMPHTGVRCSACDNTWVSLTVGLSNLWHIRTTQPHRQGPQSSWAGFDLKRRLHSIQLKPLLVTAMHSPGWEQQSHTHVAAGPPPLARATSSSPCFRALPWGHAVPRLWDSASCSLS